MQKAETNEERRRKKIVHYDIERAGEKLILPENCSYKQAIHSIERIMEQEEEPVAINAEIDCLVNDGAHALYRVLNEKFGWVNLEKTPTFFGPKPPAMISIEIGVRKSIQVPWGRMSLPGIEGYIETSVSVKSGRFIFKISGEVKRKHEAQVQEIVDRVREFVATESIYRGKPIRIRFLDDDGEVMRMPEVNFIDTSKVKEDELIFSGDLHQAVSTSIFAPIEHTQACREAGIPLKRGILLEGPYGCGKSLTAAVTAKKAERHNWTYIYCERADELKHALIFGQQYGPAVVFCEDLDRVVTGDRSLTMDELLNIVDGVASKSTELMVVLTTNHVERVNQAMLRPGRLDAVISVQPPDAEAAVGLVRLYGRDLIAEGEDLDAVGEVLNGMIPAVIREVVERAKLAAISLSSGTSCQITRDAMLSSAKVMKKHLDLLNRQDPAPKDARVVAAEIQADALKELGVTIAPALGGPLYEREPSKA